MSKFVCIKTFYDGVLVKEGEIVDRSPDTKCEHLKPLEEKVIEADVKVEAKEEPKVIKEKPKVTKSYKK